MIEAIFPGLKGMLNYHPVFVHFPIAFWLGALVLEALAQWRKNNDLHRAAVWLLYLGTLSAIPAGTTGLLAEEAAPEAGPAHEVMELHQTLMLISSSLALGLSLMAFFLHTRSAPALRRAFLIGLILLAALLSVGADRGAQLVYQYGTGVDWSKAQQQK